MLLAWLKPDDVARCDLLDRTALALHPAAPEVTIRVWPSGCVCQAVRAPGSKVTAAPPTRAGVRRGEERVDADGSGEPVRGSFA